MKPLASLSPLGQLTSLTIHPTAQLGDTTVVPNQTAFTPQALSGPALSTVAGFRVPQIYSPRSEKPYNIYGMAIHDDRNTEANPKEKKDALLCSASNAITRSLLHEAVKDEALPVFTKFEGIVHYVLANILNGNLKRTSKSEFVETIKRSGLLFPNDWSESWSEERLEDLYFIIEEYGLERYAQRLLRWGREEDLPFVEGALEVKSLARQLRVKWPLPDQMELWRKRLALLPQLSALLPRLKGEPRIKAMILRAKVGSWKNVPNKTTIMHEIKEIEAFIVAYTGKVPVTRTGRDFSTTREALSRADPVGSMISLARRGPLSADLKNGDAPTIISELLLRMLTKGAAAGPIARFIKDLSACFRKKHQKMGVFTISDFRRFVSVWDVNEIKTTKWLRRHSTELYELLFFRLFDLADSLERVEEKEAAQKVRRFAAELLPVDWSGLEGVTFVDSNVEQVVARLILGGRDILKHEGSHNYLMAANQVLSAVVGAEDMSEESIRNRIDCFTVELPNLRRELRARAGMIHNFFGPSLPFVIKALKDAKLEPAASELDAKMREFYFDRAVQRVKDGWAKEERDRLARFGLGCGSGLSGSV